MPFRSRRELGHLPAPSGKTRLAGEQLGLSENRRAEFYGLTQSGEKQLRKASRAWTRYAEAISKVLGAPEGEPVLFRPEPEAAP